MSLQSLGDCTKVSSAGLPLELDLLGVLLLRLRSMPYLLTAPLQATSGHFGGHFCFKERIPVTQQYLSAWFEFWVAALQEADWVMR